VSGIHADTPKGCGWVLRPQYTVGHGKRLEALAAGLSAHPGLILTGNSYRGIGLNDCVAAAQRASDEALGLA